MRTATNFRLLALFTFCFGFVLLGSAHAKADESQPASGTDQAPFQKQPLVLTDIHGKEYKPFGSTKKTIARPKNSEASRNSDRTIRTPPKATALIFVSTDCPIANAFQPELKKLAEHYEPKGVSFFLIYCTSRLTKERIEKHAQDFEIHIPQVLDSQQTLGKLVGARITPEAIVVDQSNRVVYRGQINNLYAGYGKKRAKPSQHYLKDACEAILAGKEIEHSETNSVGCFIQYPKASQSEKENP